MTVKNKGRNGREECSACIHRYTRARACRHTDMCTPVQTTRTLCSPRESLDRKLRKCSQTHGWQTLWSFVKQSVACLYPHSIRYCQTNKESKTQKKKSNNKKKTDKRVKTRGIAKYKSKTVEREKKKQTNKKGKEKCLEREGTKGIYEKRKRVKRGV